MILVFVYNYLCLMYIMYFCILLVFLICAFIIVVRYCFSVFFMRLSHDILFLVVLLFFFFKQKTAYEMRISDWSSDVCSSDLADGTGVDGVALVQRRWRAVAAVPARARGVRARVPDAVPGLRAARGAAEPEGGRRVRVHRPGRRRPAHGVRTPPGDGSRRARSEEHTSELQSLMRTSYPVFCLKKTIRTNYKSTYNNT